MKKTLSLLGMGLMLALGVAGNAEANHDQCQAELVGPRGYVLNVVQGYGYDRREACRDAMRSCQRLRMNGRHIGRRLLQCRIVQPMVTRVCSARVARPGIGHGPIGRPGRGPFGHPGRLGEFTASATGLAGTGVYDQACNRALMQCSRSLRHGGPGRGHGPRPLVCIADNGQVSRGRIGGHHGGGHHGGGHGPVVIPSRPDRGGQGPDVVRPRPGRNNEPIPTPPRRGGRDGGRGGRGGHQH